MPSTNHQTVTMTTEEGEEIQVRVPVGSLDKPTARGEAGFHSVIDPENWKSKTSRFLTRNREEAEEVAYAMDWYLGGHETMMREDGVIAVQSKGYYHYVGI